MKVIHIENSCNIWDRTTMAGLMIDQCVDKYSTCEVEKALNRSWLSLYVEWWLHNIGYWITKPFIWLNSKINKINLRCKDVDLQECCR